MILVDLEAASMGRTYPVQQDEQETIASLMEEITEMICQKEHCSLTGDPERMCLCCKETQVILDREATLKEYGITNGMNLILL